MTTTDSIVRELSATYPGTTVRASETCVWISGEETRAHKEALKADGFHWAYKRQAWWKRIAEPAPADNWLVWLASFGLADDAESDTTYRITPVYGCKWWEKIVLCTCTSKAGVGIHQRWAICREGMTGKFDSFSLVKPTVIDDTDHVAGLLPGKVTTQDVPHDDTKLNRYVKQVPELEAILDEYNAMYTMLYDADGTDCPLYDRPDVYAADEWGQENPYLVGRLSDYRQDLFSSDREIVALYFTLMCEPGEKKAKPAAPKQTAAPQLPSMPTSKPRKSTKQPAKKTLKFPAPVKLFIGKSVITVSEVDEYDNRYVFITVNYKQSMFMVYKTDIVSINNDAEGIHIITK